MNKEDLEKFRSVLLKEKEKLEKQMGSFSRTSFGSDVDSGEEEADETEEMVTNEAYRNITGRRLEEINKAIEKVDKGTYGVCEKCGSEIQEEVLNANPESALCKNCKQHNG